MGDSSVQLGEAAHVLDDRVAFDVGIEHVRRADLRGQLASNSDRVDGDDRRCAGDFRSLNRAQPERTASDDGDSRSRRHHASVPDRGRAESGHAHATEDHAQVHGAGLRDDRHDPLLGGDHQLGKPADMRVRVHGSAIAQVGDRRKVTGEVPPEQLAHVRASAQAVIAGATLRRARHADTIADLHAPHFGADRLDDAHAAVALDERHVVGVGTGEARVRGRGRAAGWRRRLNAEDRADVGVAEIARLGADDDLPAGDRPQPYLLQRRAATARAPRDPCSERPRGHDRWRLSKERAALRDECRAGRRSCAFLEQPATRERAVAGLHRSPSTCATIYMFMTSRIARLACALALASFVVEARQTGEVPAVQRGRPASDAIAVPERAHTKGFSEHPPAAAPLGVTGAGRRSADRCVGCSRGTASARYAGMARRQERPLAHRHSRSRALQPDRVGRHGLRDQRDQQPQGRDVQARAVR